MKHARRGPLAGVPELSALPPRRIDPAVRFDGVPEVVPPAHVDRARRPRVRQTRALLAGDAVEVTLVARHDRTDEAVTSAFHPIGPENVGGGC